ncbi:serine protease [Microbacterium sp. Bi128]|uniref:serine protease n=1 Tax=Microbacterium sp. Bi128 TaxID=2821115 RepID=UPI001D95771B|nr:serine protease [Microbacterium sp. Bi128]CAH0184888.1 hypothetical protein SRABI128_01363 [Microbacterium sp. Bi128]
MSFPSFMSVYVEAVRPSFDDPDESLLIIQGTGFVLEHYGQNFLVTNGHIVTGRDRKTMKPLGSASLPKQLRVVIPTVGSGIGEAGEHLALLGTRTVMLDLYDEDGQALWYSHPVFGTRFDVVALPIDPPARQLPDISGIYLPYRFASTAAGLEPPDEVSIVGFPYGLRGGASTAIWIRGTIATEPKMPYEGEDCFLVDARTREGQSGSPVIEYPAADAGPNEEWRLIGVYSSRVTDPSTGAMSTDLGRVWTASALEAVIDGGEPDGLVYE